MAPASSRLSSSLAGFPEDDARPHPGQLERKLALELGKGGLDRLSPGGIEKGKRQAAAGERGRRDLARERLPHDSRPAGLDPEKGALAGRHPAQHAVGRRIERAEPSRRLAPFHGVTA